ncbi:uncharacterized protein LOC135846386 [Planococcus citri]|uniref:uncharacterized protein LOC135846386 n=1 Tax=Planococcus citri TaxID=170843 RepID=UPI0031F73CD1
MDPKIISGPPVLSSLLADINIPLHQFIENSAKNHISTICMIDALTDRKLTIEAVLSQSIILAAELQALGCRPGLVVGIICENGLDYPVIMMAIFRTGATVACFNPSYSIGELEHTMNVTQPHLLFVDSSSSAKITQCSSKFKCLKHIISLEDNVKPPKLNYSSLLSRKNTLNYIPPSVSELNTSLILFSSGSTGLPKGVMLSNISVIYLFNMMKLQKEMLLDYDPVTLSVIPMFHGYGVLLVLRSFVTGGCILSLKKFNPEQFLAAIEKYKVTDLALVPALMIFLAKHPIVNNYNLSSIRNVSCGAAPLSFEIEDEVKTKLKLDKVIKGYGMTETTVLCTYAPPGIDITAGSVGKLLPGLLAKVIDIHTGELLESGQEGEICVKGILIMQGYYNNKKETENTIDPDGWLHTGDVGYYNDDEEFFIVDRIKDLIKYKGLQVAPAELEALLLKHPCVKDVAVIGVPDDIAGEVPRAFVVKMKDVTEKELVDYIAEQVAPHMKLRGGVKFITEIPRNTNGKILRRELRKWLQSKL